MDGRKTQTPASVTNQRARSRCLEVGPTEERC